VLWRSCLGTSFGTSSSREKLIGLPDAFINFFPMKLKPEFESRDGGIPDAGSVVYSTACRSKLVFHAVGFHGASSLPCPCGFVVVKRASSTRTERGSLGRGV
jgi:hypothetical protein